MPRITLLLPLLLLPTIGLVSSACLPRDAADMVDGRGVITVDEVRALAEDYNRAWEARDASAIVAFHGEGFEYYWYDQLVTGEFEAVVRDEWLADTREYHIEMERPSVELLGSDAAVISFTFRDRQLYGSGNVVRTEGALTYVLERRSGKMKIVRIHHSGPAAAVFD